MSIFTALTNAVTGLRAQSYALENISDNIANSQTSGYKRVDTSFMDMVADAPLRRQTGGAVDVLLPRHHHDRRGDHQLRTC